jgi:DNA polymerase-4
LGLHTIEQLLALPPGRTKSEVCPIAAQILSAFDGETPDLGRDRPAFREHDPFGSTVGSISNECTFDRDLSRRPEVEGHLLSLVERVCWRARKRGVRGRTVTLKLRYRDFRTVQRSRSGPPTAEDGEVMRTVRTLLERAWTRRLSVRLLGVCLSNLVGRDHQLQLPYSEDCRSPSSAVDTVRRRFGFAAIRRGRADADPGARH